MVQYQEINNPTKESAKDLNSHFSKEGIEMAIKHKKGYSASLVLRERQINCPFFISPEMISYDNHLSCLTSLSMIISSFFPVTGNGIFHPC